jgi:hypothetical protein
MPSERAAMRKGRNSCCEYIEGVPFAELKWALPVCYGDAGRYWI